MPICGDRVLSCLLGAFPGPGWLDGSARLVSVGPVFECWNLSLYSLLEYSGVVENALAKAAWVGSASCADRAGRVRCVGCVFFCLAYHIVRVCPRSYFTRRNTLHAQEICFSLALAAALTVSTMVPAFATDQIHITDEDYDTSSQGYLGESSVTFEVLDQGGEELGGGEDNQHDEKS